MREFRNAKKQLEQNLQAMERNKSISAKNKKAIQELSMKRASEGISPLTNCKIVSNFQNCLGKFAPKNFDLKTSKEDDLRKLIINLEQSEYSPRTKQSMKAIIKQYYKSIGKEKLTSFFKATVKKKDKIVINESDLLTDEEVNAIIKACKNNRDKAMVHLLYESGMRIGELGSLQVKHVTFDNYGVVVNIPTGKTGARRIRVVECERHLRQWLMDHPTEDDKNSYLWVNLNNGMKRKKHERMDYSAMKKVFEKKSIDSGVKTYKDKKGKLQTRVYPHLFRHSRATLLAKHMTEQELKVYLGWTASSEMASVYVHLSGKDVDDSILRMNGVKKDVQAEEGIRCQVCKKNNPAKALTCQNCFRPLSLKASIQIDKNKKNVNMLVEALLNGEITLEQIQKTARTRK